MKKQSAGQGQQNNSSFEAYVREKIKALEMNETARRHELVSIHVELDGLQKDNSQLLRENQELRKSMDEVTLKTQSTPRDKGQERLDSDQLYQQLLTEIDNLKRKVSPVSNVSLSDLEKQVRLILSWKSYQEEKEQAMRMEFGRRLGVLEDKVTVLPNLHEKLQSLVESKTDTSSDTKQPSSPQHSAGDKSSKRQIARIRALEEKIKAIPDLEREMDAFAEWMESKRDGDEEEGRRVDEALVQLDEKTAVIAGLQTEINVLKELTTANMSDQQEVTTRSRQNHAIDNMMMNDKFELLDDVNSQVTALISWMTSKDSRDMRHESGLMTHDAMIKELVERTEKTESRLGQISRSITKAELEHILPLREGQRVKLDRCVGILGNGGIIDQDSCCLLPQWDGDYVIGVIWSQVDQGELYVYLNRTGQLPGESATIGKTDSDEDVCSVQEVIRMKKGEALWLEVERVSGPDASMGWCFFYCWLL